MVARKPLAALLFLIHANRKPYGMGLHSSRLPRYARNDMIFNNGMYS
jgi:hypothetical protein